MKRKRNSYTAELKLNVIKYAEEHGNRAAGREFNVDEKCVRTWRQQKPTFLELNPRKRACRGLSAQWPELEDKLKTWVLTKRKGKRSVSTLLIQFQAKRFAREMNIANFSASKGWLAKFMDRNSLSVRARTTVGQKLPDQWPEKLALFQRYVFDIIHKHNYSSKCIVNMDEVPMCFDSPASRTVDEIGVSSVGITSTGHDKSGFTVVLACTASGHKLTPMVIFKRKTIPKESFPKGIVVHCNEKGWMNTTVMEVWGEQCFSTRPNSIFERKSLLILDSMASHKDENAKKWFKSNGTELAVIPGGLTSKLQPLDISVNRSFKSLVRSRWEDWMSSGEHTFTAAGNQRRASYSLICNWIVESWKEVPATAITNGFRKAGIWPSNPEISSSTEEDDDDECYSTDSSDDKSDFEGF